MLTLQKHEGLYQNRVTDSLASIVRPGNLATTVKWSIVPSRWNRLSEKEKVGLLLFGSVNLIITTTTTVF